MSGVPGLRPAPAVPHNGLVTKPYDYGRPPPPWAVRALTAAEAAYGQPPESRPRGRPKKDGQPPQQRTASGDGYCDGCGYQLTAIGHKITCGAS